MTKGTQVIWGEWVVGAKSKVEGTEGRDRKSVV